MQATLLFGATSTGPGKAISGLPAKKTVHANVEGTGLVSATVVIEGKNGGERFLPIATVMLSGTDFDIQGFVQDAAWVTLRANVTALSGTGATVAVYLGA